jgi:type II secretory pathway pseudopilin PulG
MTPLSFQRRRRRFAFSLAELLIVMTILAEIATFTIPKVLVAQENQAYNAKTKEAVATMAEALQSYKYANPNPPAGTMAANVLPAYINYIKKIEGLLDSDPDETFISPRISCISDANLDLYIGPGNYVYGTCMVLPSGAVLVITTDTSYGAIGGNIAFYVDPDGKFTVKHDTAVFLIKPNGRITSFGADNNDPSMDPTWFHW